MKNRDSVLNYKKIQPLIRHCWEYNIYTKKSAKVSFKEKFINFLILDGKKTKAYKIFNQMGSLTRKKILQNDYQKKITFFGNQQETILKMKILFLTTKTSNKIKQKQILSLQIQKSDNISKKTEEVIHTNKIYNNFSTSIAIRKKIPPFENVILQAIDNVKPSLEVRKVRIAGTTYLVPAIIPKTRQQTLAIKWIIEAARKKKRKTNLPFSECLASEAIDAFFKQGQARQKRDDLHKLAEANRAYTRYRWW